MNRDLLFFILFSLSVLKIAHLSNINRFIGAFNYLIIISIFIYIFFVKKNWKIYFEKYKFESILTFFLCLIFFISLLIHYKDYKNLKFFIIYGISSIVVFTILPLCWVIFNSTNRKTFFPDILFIFIHLIAIGQYLKLSFVKKLLYYTVATDAFKKHIISSVFRWRTIYGTFSALILLYSIIYFINANNKKEKFLYSILFFTSLVGGSLSNSRNFFLTLIFGLFFIVIMYFKRKIFSYILIFFILSLTLFHILAWHIPSIAKRYSLIFPYFRKLHTPEKIKIKDFIPKINTSSLSGRNKIWKKAIELWKSSKILGIGPGNFRIHSHFGLIHNVHNFFLQTLVEGGIIAFICLILILIKLFYNIKFSPILPIFVGAIVALNFDNYLDHSMGWVISLCWMLQPLKNEKN